MSKLNARQLRFVEAYVVLPNAAAAAREAGYSKATADRIGSRLLKNAGVKAAIAEHQARAATKAEVDAVEVLRELKRIALVDVADIFDEQGRLKPLKEIPVDARRAIAGIETDELFGGAGENRIELGQTRKLKFWDKPKALELLGKHLKLFTDKVEVGFGDMTDEQLVARFQALIAKGAA